MNKKPVCWNGVEYESLSAAARAAGVGINAMRVRLARGYTQDSDMVKPQRPVTWNGVEYPTINAAAQATGIIFQTLHTWIGKGYRCTSDLNKIEWDGKHYPSRRAAACASGLPLQTLAYHYRRGRRSTVEVENARACTWDGVTYASMAEAGRALGITREGMRQRLKRAAKRRARAGDRE